MHLHVLLGCLPGHVTGEQFQWPVVPVRWFSRPLWHGGVGEAEGLELLVEGEQKEPGGRGAEGAETQNSVLMEEGLLPEMAQMSSADHECYPWREEGSPGFAELPQGSQAKLRAQQGG